MTDTQPDFEFKNFDNGATITIVPLANMKVRDGITQRAQLSRAHVDKLKANWTPMFSPLPSVNYVGGWYYIMDGWHTKTALEEMGYKVCRCQVFYGLSEADEARFFNSQKRKLNVQPLDHFTVRLRGEQHPDAVALKRVMDEQDLEFDYFRGSDRKVRCVQTFENLWAKYGEKVFEPALRTLNSAFGPIGITAGTITAMCRIVDKNPTMKVSIMVKQLKKKTPTALDAEVSIQRASNPRVKSPSHALEILMVRAYNDAPNLPDADRIKPSFRTD